MTSISADPSSFLGLPWESWANSLDLSVPIDDKPPEPNVPEKNKAGVMKLPKTDMKIFGLCPERDSFTVVVCEACKLCIKQQAFAEHFKKRHLTKDARPMLLPFPDRPIVPEKMAAKVVKNASAKVKRKRVPSKEAVVTNSSKGKEVVNPVPSLPVSLTLEGVSPHVVDSPPTKVEVLQPVITVNDAPPVTVSPATNVTNKQTTKPRRAPRKIGPIKQREYDPDKHCGVVSTETMKPCTWSLTCKSHPMSLRRAVTGRSKPFDQLLADHRKAKEALIKQKKNLELLNSPTPQTVSLTPASSQKEKETPGSVVVSEKVVKAMRGGAVASAQSSPSVVHTVTAQAAVSTPLPVTKQSVVLNTSGSWNLNLVTNASNPLVRRLPEMKLDVTPAKRLYLSSQPQNLIIKSSASEKPLPVYVSPAAISERDLDRLSVSLNPPRALAVSTPMFTTHRVGGLLYANRRMQLTRQSMKRCMHSEENSFPHSGTTIYHLPASFFSAVLDHHHHHNHDHHKK